jgi:hypothetical protein
MGTDAVTLGRVSFFLMRMVPVISCADPAQLNNTPAQRAAIDLNLMGNASILELSYFVALANGRWEAQVSELTRSLGEGWYSSK